VIERGHFIEVHHGFSSDIIMGFHIHSRPNSYPRKSDEYIILCSVRSSRPVNLHYKEHPRRVFDDPRSRPVDSYAMVSPLNSCLTLGS
jgi:hypothetical protein